MATATTNASKSLKKLLFLLACGQAIKGQAEAVAAATGRPTAGMAAMRPDRCARAVDLVDEGKQRIHVFKMLQCHSHTWR